jgi:uncharacterized membrane protein
MLNKKIVAAAVAAAFTQSAVAAVNIDETTLPQQVTFASELVTSVAGFATVQSGLLGPLEIEVAAGFSITSGASKYMRFDFTGAKFVTGLTATTLVTPNGVADLSQNGATGDSTVIFEVAAPATDVAPGDIVTLSADDYAISDSGTAEVCYALYETAGQAVSQEQPLKSACQSFATVSSAYSGTFASGEDQFASVDSNFTKFTDGATPPVEAEFAVIGIVDATGAAPVTPATSTSILVPNTFDAAGAPVTAEVLINATIPTTAVTQVIRVTGDFTFGTWTLESSALCDGSGTLPAQAITPDVSKTFGETPTVSTADLTSQPWYVCVNVTGSETIQKDDYSVTLVDSVLTNPIGTIKYDTTSIEVPYLTTFSEYKQRIYLINKGTQPAEYSMKFHTEVGTEAVDGSKATGVVPAGKMLMINAADAVTLTGLTTRTAATIEVEGVDAKIQAAIQSVNLETKDTDTVVLNANSITSPTL